MALRFETPSQESVDISTEIRKNIIIDVFDQINDFESDLDVDGKFMVRRCPDINIYLDQWVFIALKSFCDDDKLQEKYNGLPKKILENIFIDNTKCARNFKEIGSEFCPLVQMLRDYCVENTNDFKYTGTGYNDVELKNRIDEWFGWIFKKSIKVKSANKR